jgi:hypothetical protein
MTRASQLTAEGARVPLLWPKRTEKQTIQQKVTLIEFEVECNRDFVQCLPVREAFVFGCP